MDLQGVRESRCLRGFSAPFSVTGFGAVTVKTTAGPVELAHPSSRAPTRGHAGAFADKWGGSYPPASQNTSRAADDPSPLFLPIAGWEFDTRSSSSASGGAMRRIKVIGRLPGREFVPVTDLGRARRGEQRMARGEQTPAMSDCCSKSAGSCSRLRRGGERAEKLAITSAA